MRVHSSCRYSLSPTPPLGSAASTLHWYPSRDPCLLALEVVSHVHVTHSRQFTGGQLRGGSLRIPAVEHYLDVLIGERLWRSCLRHTSSLESSQSYAESSLRLDRPLIVISHRAGQLFSPYDRASSLMATVKIPIVLEKGLVGFTRFCTAASKVAKAALQLLLSLGPLSR